ncbi:MAG: hypothetical protein WCF18_12140 [Chthoniobacteraceae bacterium]
MPILRDGDSNDGALLVNAGAEAGPVMPMEVPVAVSAPSAAARPRSPGEARDQMEGNLGVGRGQFRLSTGKMR